MIRTKGFTLIEAILSMALLAIIAIFILPMSMYGVKYTKWNNIKLSAINLAYNQVEWLKTVEYKDLGLDNLGYTPKGIVKEDLYLNESNTNPVKIDNVEYRIFTSIYWESSISSNDDFVANATKKVDVVVKAKDIFTGAEKTYSVMGTSIAFEGERTPSILVPLKVRVITGEDYNVPAKNVTVDVNYSNNIKAAFGRTDNLGEIFFPELTNGIYKVIPTKWEKGNMLSRPTGLTGNGPNQSYIFLNQVEIKATKDDFIETVLYVDYPGKIKLSPYSDEILNNTILTLSPTNYTPPEGEIINLNLNIKLSKLNDLNIWREWNYSFDMTHDTNKYYFINKNTGNLWDGKFIFNKDNVTTNNLSLGFGLKDGNFEKESNGTISLEVEFTSEIMGDINEIQFLLYENDSIINYSNVNISQIIAGKNNRFRINLSTTNNIIENNLKFDIINPNHEIFTNAYGMKLVQDRASCNLIKK